MNDPTTPEGRAHLRQRIEQAVTKPTTARWVSFGNSIGAEVDQCTCSGHPYEYLHEQYCGVDGPVVQGVHESDAELIVAAVNALPALLDALDQARRDYEENMRAGLRHKHRADEAEAALERVRELTYASDDGLEYDHNGPASVCGEPECPACWAQAIRKALDGGS